VKGRWILHGTLSLQEARDLPVPAAGQIDGTVFRFVAVRTSPAAIQVKMAIVGPLAGKLNDVGHIAEALKPQPGLTIELVDPSGLAQMQINGRTSITDNRAELEWMWVAPSAGHYQIVVTLLGEGSFTRPIDVP
jgi:cell division inhibitor SulA